MSDAQDTAACPVFRAYVTDSGGGTVTLIVDRDTDYYPAPGTHVTVTPDSTNGGK